MNGTTNQPNLLELAKQGNAKAIATLINRQLQPKGITAKAALKDGCLQVMLESAQAPNQQSLFAFVRKGITGLGAASIQKVKVYGQQSGEDFPSWYQEFEVVAQAMPNFVELAKQGDVKAITTLISQWLQPQSITAKASLKDGCLQVMLESNQVPEQQSVAPLLRDRVMGLSIQAVNKVKLYGRQKGEEFPSWHQELSLVGQQQPSESVPRVDNESQPSVSNVEADSKAKSSSDTTSQIDIIELSNTVYETLHKTFYQPLLMRFQAENEEENVYEIVRAFDVDELEEDLNLVLKSIERELLHLMGSCFPESETGLVDTGIVALIDSIFSSISKSIEQLSQVSHEIYAYNFTEETGIFAELFKGGFDVAASKIGGQEVTHKETAIGAAIGSVLMPGVGTVIGGAIGGLLASSKQRQEVENILERYRVSYDKVIQEYDKLWEIIYRHICDVCSKLYRIKLKYYQDFQEEFKQYKRHFERAINLYEESNFDGCIKEIKKATEIFPTKEQPYMVALGELQGDESKLTQFYLFLGNAYLEAGQPYSAEKFYTDLLSKDYSNTIAYYGLARVFSVMNDTNNALNYLEQAVAKGFNDFEAIESNKDFSNIRSTSRYKNIVSVAQAIASEVGVDYTRLRDLLAKEKWKEADRETWNAMCRVVGKPEGSCLAPKDIDNFPCRDLQTIDRLWIKHSAGKFGFSVQREILDRISGDIDKFKKSVKWMDYFDIGNYEYPIYGNLENLKCRGHLPYICHNKGRVFFMDDSEIIWEILERMGSVI
jgi:tetratricopeptide (TPR) repeat protein